MLVFVEGGKPEKPVKNPRSKARSNNKLNSHMALSWNRTWRGLFGGRTALSSLRHPCFPPRQLCGSAFLSAYILQVNPPKSVPPTINFFLTNIVPTLARTPVSLLLLVTAKHRSIPLLVFIPLVICVVWQAECFERTLQYHFPACAISSERSELRLLLF